MPLSERGRAILAVIEHNLPSRRALASLSISQKLDVLELLKRAADRFDQGDLAGSTNSETP
jgi:hypothetical protein